MFKLLELWCWVFCFNMLLIVFIILGVIGFMLLKKVNGNWWMYVFFIDVDMLLLVNLIIKGSLRLLILLGFL